MRGCNSKPIIYYMRIGFIDFRRPRYRNTIYYIHCINAVPHDPHLVYNMYVSTGYNHLCSGVTKLQRSEEVQVGLEQVHFV